MIFVMNPNKGKSVLPFPDKTTMKFTAAIVSSVTVTLVAGAQAQHQQEPTAASFSSSCDKISHISSVVLAIVDGAVSDLVGPSPPDDKREESTCQVAEDDLGTKSTQLPQASEHCHDTIQNILDSSECKNNGFLNDDDCLEVFESTAVEELHSLISVYSEVGSATFLRKGVQNRRGLQPEVRYSSCLVLHRPFGV